MPSNDVRLRWLQSQSRHLRTKVDGHLRYNISDRVSRTGNELAIPELLIQPFKWPFRHVKLDAAVVLELPSYKLREERACVLERASDRTEQEQFHSTVPLFDKGLLACINTHQVGLGMKTLDISTDSYRFCQVGAVVELKYRHATRRILSQEFGRAPCAIEDVDVFMFLRVFQSVSAASSPVHPNSSERAYKLV